MTKALLVSSFVYRICIAAILVAAFFYLYFTPIFPRTQLPQALLVFSILAILLETLEIRIPKMPAIYLGDLAYIAALFLFPAEQIFLLIATGAAGRALLLLHLEASDALRVLRRFLVYGLSVSFFVNAGLSGSRQAADFGGLPIRSQIGQNFHLIKFLIPWALGYGVAQYFLMQVEIMILRGVFKISVNWPSFRRYVLFNLLFVWFGHLTYLAYAFLPNSFPFGVMALIPVLSFFYFPISKVFTPHLEGGAAALEAITEAEEAKQRNSGYSRSMARLARLIAIRLGLNEVDVETVSRASGIHSLGFVGVDDKLKEHGPITKDDEAAMAKHAGFGVKIALQHPLLYLEAAELIRNHHENYDGTGLPLGLRGDQIPLGSRILAVADAYISLTFGSAYKSPITHDDAIGAIRRESGKRFDPKVVEAFSRVKL